MADRSKIEWTEATWNPVVGCSVVSPGCTHCYAMRMAARIEAAQPRSHYAGTTTRVNGHPVWTGALKRASDHVLRAPLRRTKPTTWFVNSMSDLFHEDVPDEWIDRVFAVMALCPQHTFQVLTKRAERMRAYCGAVETLGRVTALLTEWLRDDGHITIRDMPDGLRGLRLPNCWLGVSAEDQRRADERIPHLLATPAALRFVSCEPLLEPIRLARWLPRIDWVVVGSESGPRARLCDLAWMRDIRDQCQAAGVPFFLKQHTVNGRKVSTPELDGKRWVELPRSPSA